MSQIGQNDLAVLLNRRVLRHLTISQDQALRRSVENAADRLDQAAAASPTMLALAQAGLEDPMETAANLQVPLPRLLYATTNPAYNPAPPPGASDFDVFRERLQEFEDVATGPVIASLPDQGCVPLPNGQTACFPNPCPLDFRSDPGQRVTFLRTGFLSPESPEFVRVDGQEIVFTVQGQAFRGDTFSRFLAEHQPTHQFTLELRYEVTFVDDPPADIGPHPFAMTASPPEAAATDGPRLPSQGRFVYATWSENENRYFLPRLLEDDNGQPTVQPPNLAGDLFRGRMDDVIYENVSDDEPRYRIEPRSDDEPLRLVIREIGDESETVLAEARDGHMAIAFTGAEVVSLTPIGNAGAVSGSDRSRIESSIIRYNPTLLQLLTCDAVEPQGLNLSLLDLLGPRAMDYPIPYQSLVFSAEARVVTQDDIADPQEPGPVNSVHGGVIEAHFKDSVYFDAGDAQSFGIVARVDPNAPGDPGGVGDFSAGADMSVALGDTLFTGVLQVLNQKFRQQIIDQGPDGLDVNTLQTAVFFQNDQIRLRATAEGTQDTPWFLPDIGFDFQAGIDLRFRVQPLVFVDDSGHPMGRFHCPVPSKPLDDLGLRVLDNQLFLENAEANPLSFAAYNDPFDGIACADDPQTALECMMPERIPPPVLDGDGNEIDIPDPSNPPVICCDPAGDDCVQRSSDDTSAWGQASFDPELNPHLKHVLGVLPLPPGEDDVHVAVNLDIGALILTGLIGSLAAPFLIAGLAHLGPLGIAVTPVVLSVLFSGLVILPAAGLIIGSVATWIIRDRLRDELKEPIEGAQSPAPFLDLYLDGDLPGPPFRLEASSGPGNPGALVLRLHAVIGSLTTNDLT